MESEHLGLDRILANVFLFSHPGNVAENINISRVGDKGKIATPHDCLAIQFKRQPLRSASQMRMEWFQCRRQTIGVVARSSIRNVEVSRTEGCALSNGGCQTHDDKLHPILNQAL